MKNANGGSPQLEGNYLGDFDELVGCGFCAGVCPCGVWEMIENV